MAGFGNGPKVFTCGRKKDFSPPPSKFTPEAMTGEAESSAMASKTGKNALKYLEETIKCETNPS
ncbi:MAG: hypothetical protein NPINA01_08030 [Nitrospinaceae bacterium]|nr:MAG: hypothetical protein NPINA01_08030 [Nitrospinaceae bacterium]